MGQALCGSFLSLKKILKLINPSSQDLLLYFLQNAIMDCVYCVISLAEL